MWVRPSRSYRLILYIALSNLVHLSKGEAVSCCREFGEGNKDVVIVDVECSGSEETVTTCTYLSVTEPVTHEQDVGVRCQQG